MADTVLVHPNRDKAESKATKAIVVLLLIVERRPDPRRDDRRLVGSFRARRSSRLPRGDLHRRWPSSSVAGTAACCRWRPAGDAVLRDRRGRRPGLVRPRQGRLQRADARPLDPRPAHADPRPGPAAPGRVRDARVPAAVERGDRDAPRGRRRLRRLGADPAGLAGSLRRRCARAYHCPVTPGWRNWHTRWPQKPLSLCGLVGSSPTPGTARDYAARRVSRADRPCHGRLRCTPRWC